MNYHDTYSTKFPYKHKIFPYYHHITIQDTHLRYHEHSQYSKTSASGASRTKLSVDAEIATTRLEITTTRLEITLTTLVDAEITTTTVATQINRDISQQYIMTCHSSVLQANKKLNKGYKSNQSTGLFIVKVRYEFRNSKLLYDQQRTFIIAFTPSGVLVPPSLFSFRIAEHAQVNMYL